VTAIELPSATAVLEGRGPHSPEQGRLFARGKDMLGVSVRSADESFNRHRKRQY